MCYNVCPYDVCNVYLVPVCIILHIIMPNKTINIILWESINLQKGQESHFFSVLSTPC